MLLPKYDKAKAKEKIENTSDASASSKTDSSVASTNTDTAQSTNSVTKEEPVYDDPSEPASDVIQNNDAAVKEAQEREAEKKRKAEEEKKLKAEQTKQPPASNKVLDIAPVMPSYPKGNNKVMDFINSRKHNPTGESGFVVVQFVVNKNGSLSDFKVVKSMNPENDQEALRVCKMLPNFNPGRDEHGNPVNVRFSLPVRF